MLTRRSALKCGALLASSTVAQAFTRGGNPPQLQQFYDRLLTLPTLLDHQRYLGFVTRAVIDGWWNDLDFIYLRAAADGVAAMTNLKSGNYTASLAGANHPTFTPNLGITTGSGGGGFLDTNYNPSTAGGLMTQNNMSLCVYNKSTGLSSNNLVDFGGSGFLLPFYSTNQMDFAIGDATDTVAGNPNDASGFWLLERTDANTKLLRRNDVAQLTGNVPSIAPANANIRLVTGNSASGSHIEMMSAGGRALVTATKRTSIFQAAQTFLLAKGALP